MSKFFIEKQFSKRCQLIVLVSEKSEIIPSNIPGLRKIHCNPDSGYSQSMCKDMCKVKHIERVCGCQPHGFGQWNYGIKYCNFQYLVCIRQSVIQNLDIAQCENACLPKCTKWTYRLSETMHEKHPNVLYNDINKGLVRVSNQTSSSTPCALLETPKGTVWHHMGIVNGSNVCGLMKAVPFIGIIHEYY